MPSTDKVLYTARTHTTGGRDGAARSSDGRLDVQLTSPGAPGVGTNPEQLFAAGWSACFIGAIGVVAAQKHIVLPEAPTIDATIDLLMEGSAFFLRAKLDVTIPGLDIETARELTHLAHEICPYSKATRGNIGVEINIA